MTHDPDETAPKDTKPRVYKSVFVLIALYAAVEAVLFAGDFGLIDIPRFRLTVYEFAGFWPGILKNWEPNYAAQPWLMFFTYGFLHSGWVHLVVNMITLASVAPLVLDRVGQWKGAFIYAFSILGGAVGFAVLSDSFRPMVGASGALFGLVGAILAWEYVDRFTFRAKLWPVLRAVGFLIALNVVLYFAMDRLLAWEAHLGGFIAGWLAALLVDPRSRDIDGLVD
ncbi:MAG: rhomboid family intramembrane serine protease [Boseongicola sp.]|nr:rhomboid family intramembrane serine protease [Boseongicola sp.]NNJ69519.1 rhomboid family intramembrane serine protease [Boseongicola sp.]